MKLHEYQAKALLESYGVSVPTNVLALTAEEAQVAADTLGGPAVIKAQVHAGGRGKAGGVKLAHNPSEAAKIAESLLGTFLVTQQTGPQGAPVEKVLVEQTVDVEREIYLSVITDGRVRRPVIIASSEGGVEIEEVAKHAPEKILREEVDPAIGVQSFQGRRLAYGLDLDPALVRPFVELVRSCYTAYQDKDCTMVEINPLVITKDGRLLALDAKLTIDDDSLFRHPDEADWSDPGQEDPLEVEAAKSNIAYVKLDGNVGCMVNGAGLAMATMDTIHAAGGSPANFLDVGGGASQEKVARAIMLMISDDQVEKVLVNIFGGILRCDIVARGIMEAYTESDRKPPLVVRMLGTNMDEARKLLSEWEMEVSIVNTLPEAAQAIVLK